MPQDKEKKLDTKPNGPQQRVVENQQNESPLNEEDTSVLERNKALLQYTATIANSNNSKDEFNYEFVESLVKGGADINIADQHNQTIFHEVARSWNTDIAQFLIKLGCEVNKQDSFGRGPLHVAAAVDYVEMIEFLLLNNADLQSKTYGELQTPIHYAAKNGATRSLKMLLSFNANIDTRDAKQRTPLQVAAEWRRGAAAKMLVDEGAASYLLDNTGNSALCVLIDHLPNIAVEALNQLHTTDLITMQEYYYLQHLEASREKVETKNTRTALETAVTNRKYEVITHPVMQRLVQNKWNQFGRLSTTFDLLFHVVFCVAWTAFALATPEQSAYFYDGVVDQAWKISVGVLILLMTLYDIIKHVQATFKSRRSQRNWINWKMEQLEYDSTYCHPRWPQEQKFVTLEMKRVRALPLFDAYDAWFYMDWIILFLILATIVTHFVFLYNDTSAMRYLYTHTISIVNLLVGLRLLKFVRPFHGIGTLVLILSETIGDFTNWAFLFLLILVPFAASFWINFGALSIHPVHGYHTTGELLYRVFQMAVGDDFDLENIVEADAVMARILVVLYVTAMTIVTLNLLIALLSDTFSRVYNNAVSNTAMQRAIKVIESERTLRKKKKEHYKEYMKMNCSPEIIAMQVAPRNENQELKKDISNDLMDAKAILDDRFGKAYGKDKSSDFDDLLADFRKICKTQDVMTSDLLEIKRICENLASGKSTIARNIKRGHERSLRRSLQKQESSNTGFVSTLQSMLPRWLTSKKEDINPRGNRRRHRPDNTSQNEEAVRRRRARRTGVVSREGRNDGQSGNKLKRRGRRKTKKEASAYTGHQNPGYDPELEYDTADLDSS